MLKKINILELFKLTRTVNIPSTFICYTATIKITGRNEKNHMKKTIILRLIQVKKFLFNFIPYFLFQAKYILIRFSITNYFFQDFSI